MKHKKNEKKSHWYISPDCGMDAKAAYIKDTQRKMRMISKI